MRPSSPVLIVSLTALISLAGCGPKGEPLKTSAPAPTLAAGWSVTKDPESGFSMGYPTGWRVGVPKGMMGESAMGSGYSANPTVGDMMGGGAAPEPALESTGMSEEAEALAGLRAQGILLQCVDASRAIPGEEPTRFYLKKLPDCGGLEGAKSAEKDVLSNEGAGKAVTLPIGKAWMFENKGKNRIGDTERHITYILGDGGDGYVLRFVSTNNPTAFDAFHLDVAKSLRKKAVAKAKE